MLVLDTRMLKCHRDSEYMYMPVVFNRFDILTCLNFRTTLPFPQLESGRWIDGLMSTEEAVQGGFELSNLGPTLLIIMLNLREKQ